MASAQRSELHEAESRIRLREIIREKSFLRGATFTLASGQASGVYFDMKPTMFDPEGITLLASCVFDAIRDENAQSIGGLEIGAIPIIAAVCMQSFLSNRPLNGFFVRKEPKTHGTKKLIDGQFEDGDRVILLDDITTTGGSVMKAVRAVRERNGKVSKIVTVVDRLEGAKANLAEEGIELAAIFTKEDFVG